MAGQPEDCKDIMLSDYADEGLSEEESIERIVNSFSHISQDCQEKWPEHSRIEYGTLIQNSFMPGRDLFRLRHLSSAHSVCNGV